MNNGKIRAHEFFSSEEHERVEWLSMALNQARLTQKILSKLLQDLNRVVEPEEQFTPFELEEVA